jgi:hypothetical protein
MMNEEQVQQGRDALIGLGWGSESISEFCKIQCHNDIRLQIADGLTPYLKSVVKQLRDIDGELSGLVAHIEDFSNV